MTQTFHIFTMYNDNFLRSLLFSPYWEQIKVRKISKTLPNHKTKLKKIEIGRITILNGSTSIQYGQESITGHNLSTTFDTCVKSFTGFLFGFIFRNFRFGLKQIGLKHIIQCSTTRGAAAAAAVVLQHPHVPNRST